MFDPPLLPKSGTVVIHTGQPNPAAAQIGSRSVEAGAATDRRTASQSSSSSPHPLTGRTALPPEEPLELDVTDPGNIARFKSALENGGDLEFLGNYIDGVIDAPAVPPLQKHALLDHLGLVVRQLEAGKTGTPAQTVAVFVGLVARAPADAICTRLPEDPDYVFDSKLHILWGQVTRDDSLLARLVDGQYPPALLPKLHDTIFQYVHQLCSAATGVPQPVLRGISPGSFANILRDNEEDSCAAKRAYEPDPCRLAAMICAIRSTPCRGLEARLLYPSPKDMPSDQELIRRISESGPEGMRWKVMLEAHEA